jgi:excisionase family DNA binding protein
MSRTVNAPPRSTYTVDEVAIILGISRTTAYECVRRGDIPSRRFGRRVVVLRHELSRLLNAETNAFDG